jgi:peroxiredoxin
MEPTLLVARLGLASVLLLAAVAKLSDRGGTESALRDFGVPEGLTRVGVWLLPLSELVVGALLLFATTARLGALGALMLLMAFSAAILVALKHGRQPDCHCFGRLSNSPIGWSTLVRNGVFALVAGFILVAGPGHGISAWLNGLTVSQQTLLAVGLPALLAIATLAWFVWQLLLQQGRLLLRVDALEERDFNRGPRAAELAASGLPIGTPAPPFALSGLDGDTVTLEALASAGKPLMLIFSDPRCGPCNDLMPQVGRWQREHALKFTTALISRGAPDENVSKRAQHGLTTVLIQEDREVADLYQATSTPSAVLVSSQGRIGSPVASGAEAIRLLLSDIVGTVEHLPHPSLSWGRGTHAPGAPRTEPIAMGAQAPNIQLPNLDGRTVTLEEYRGDPTLVLFWRPSCGFCQGMLEDLKSWEADPPEGAPRLLIISSESTEENAKMALRSQVLLESSFQVGYMFGVTGTPSAVLIDAEGRVASAPAVGAEAVLDLAGVRSEPYLR